MDEGILVSFHRMTQHPNTFVKEYPFNYLNPFLNQEYQDLNEIKLESWYKKHLVSLDKSMAT